MKTQCLSVLVASFLFAACGKEAHVHTPGDGHGKETGHTDDHAAGGHGAMASLGSIQLGSVAVEVSQEGTVEAGKEVGVDLSFAKGKPVPSTVRAWVGVESAAGSLKAKLAKEGEDGMHGHLEVPKPLPDGSKLWFEADGAAGTSKASIAFRK
jgi:hypothetical protein